jgi:hypothetical protein
MPSEVNAQLKQQGSYGQQREYQLLNGQSIRIAIGGKARTKVYDVPILALATKSKPRLNIAWGWLWLALAGLIAIPLYLVLKSSLGSDSAAYDFAILAGLSVAALIGFIMLGLNFSRKRVYYTAYSKVPLFDILIGKPDYQSYKQFLNMLEGYQQKARSHWNLRVEQQIAGEIRTLRRLASEGVIPKKVYERAKDMLFGMTNKMAKQTR